MRVQGILATVRLALAQGDYWFARPRAEEGIVLARRTGRDEMAGRALGLLGMITTLSGEPESSKASVEESIALLRNSNDTTGLATSLTTRALISAQAEKDYRAARQYLDESTRVAQDSGLPWEAAVSMTNIGQVALLLGDYNEARARYRECIELFGEAGDRHFGNVARSGLAETERLGGNPRAAVPLYGKTILEWRELGNRGGIARCIECLAFIATGNGDLKRAGRLFGAAEALREASGSPMTRDEVIEYNREVAVLRSKTDENTWRPAWEEGRALSMDRAIAFALEG